MNTREQGAGSREQGAGSREQGAGSREQGARNRVTQWYKLSPFFSLNTYESRTLNCQIYSWTRKNK